MSDPMVNRFDPANRFDFRGLSTNPPSGLTISAATDEYLHAVRETARGTKHFFLFKRAGIFRLHAQNPDIEKAVGLEACNESNLVLTGPEVTRLLRLIGF